jgi:uncharacterized membrane protein YccC
LLEIGGVPAHTTVQSRAFATLAGGALAMLAAVALPAWERQYLPSRLVDLLEAYRRYLRTVADLATDRAALQRGRIACRLARTNAQASVDRARSEPVRGHAQVELGRAVLAHSHRFIHAMLSVEAIRVPVRKAGGVPELRTFLDAAGEHLELAAAALSRNEAPGPPAPLRPHQEQLAAAVLGTGATVDVETATAMVEATDRITNSLDTLLDELRRQLPLPG